jgi:hypothetical protein
VKVLAVHQVTDWFDPPRDIELVTHESLTNYLKKQIDKTTKQLEEEGCMVSPVVTHKLNRCIATYGDDEYHWSWKEYTVYNR